MSSLFAWLPLALNTLIPLAGVFIFQWSIGDIFFLFFFEILILGAESSLKILTALGEKPWYGCIGHFLRFSLIYPILFLFVLVATGWLFNGSDDQMEITLTGNTFLILFGMYFLNLLFFWFFNGKFKRTTPKEVEKETYFHLLAIFLVIFVLLWPLSYVTSFSKVNYGLAIGIVLAKNAADYFVFYRKYKATK